MIVRTTHDISDGPFHRRGPGWESLRYLTAGDKCGFSLHLTTVTAGSESTLWYKHHIEANLCVAGTGSVTDVLSGETARLSPGVMYTLDQHDRHILRADADGDMTLVCVFVPALRGDETHDADGSYLPLAD